MILLLRTVARLVGILVLALLAVAGIATAVFALGSGDGAFSLPGALDLVGAPRALEQTQGLVAQVAADGPVAIATLQWAAIAAVAALLVLFGVLAPRRERLVRVQIGGREVRVRRRALAKMAVSAVEHDRSVGRARGRARPRRGRRGAVLKVRVSPGIRRVEPADLKATATARLKPLTDQLAARARVKVKGDS